MREREGTPTNVDIILGIVGMALVVMAALMRAAVR